MIFPIRRPCALDLGRLTRARSAEEFKDSAALPPPDNRPDLPLGSGCDEWGLITHYEFLRVVDAF